MNEHRLVFPCGAYFPVKHGDEILDAAHRAKDGAYRIGVYPSSQPHATDATIEAVKNRWRFDLKGKRAPCLGVCPNRSRRKEEHGYDGTGQFGVYVSCHARLFESVYSQLDGWAFNDITPPRPAKCPHCEEQRTYVQACRRAAKYHEDAPAREKWRKCPDCGEYHEMYEDTGMCASCQLVQVVEANSDPSEKPCLRCGKRVSAGWLFKTVEAVQSLNQLYEKLGQLKAHACSCDERESGCPVCADEKQIEHEIRLLGGRVRRPNRG